MAKKAAKKQKAKGGAKLIARGVDLDLVEFTTEDGHKLRGRLLWHDGVYRKRLVWVPDADELYGVYDDFTVVEARSQEVV